MAEKPGLFSCLILLLNGFDTRAIGYVNQIPPSDVYLYMRELEKLQLVRMGINDSVHLLVSKPIHWRLSGGPLHPILEQVHQVFITQALIKQHEGDFPFYSSNRLFSKESIRLLKDDIDKLYQRFQQQASLDQAFYPPEELETFKMLLTMAPFNVADFFPVPPYRANLKSIK